jgi:limonene 1,2-monooxygenase
MSDLYLRSGIFMAPFHNHDENPTLSIERDLELLEHLDRLNYHEAWIGEHHSGGFELIAAAHAAYPARHRRRVIALSQPVHARRPHGPARPHDARPRNVRRRSGGAGA